MRTSLGWAVGSGGLLALGALPWLCACADDAGGSRAASASNGGSFTGAAGGVSLAGSAGAPLATGGVAGSASGGAVASAGAPSAAGVAGVGGVATAGDGGTGLGGTSAGTAGAAGSTGGSGSAGAGLGGSTSADCNSVTGQPVITVGPSGADFQKLQAALDSLSKTNSTPTQIRIAPGTYKEKLTVQIPNVTLCGQAGKASTTILTYSDNANTSNGNGGTLGTTGSASTNITSSNVSAQNLTFANSTVLGGSQAVALLVSGDQVQFRNSRFISFQDTLYVRKAKQYFRDCYIEGTVDFIFGDATAVFEACTVHNVSGGTAATAPNTDQAVPYGLVFLGGQLTAASSISAGSIALGRNWGAYGAAVYLRTQLGAHIKPAGWVPMGDNTLDTARFAEYKTTGPGATASALAARAPQSKQLGDQEAANYTLPKIFGSWLPSFSK